MKNPDVLIYVQKIRDYLESSEIVKKYFLANIDIEIFMEEVYKTAETNFNTNGDPILPPFQIDEIKNGLTPKVNNPTPFYFSFCMN